MVEMGKSIKSLVPNLWNLLGVLLNANTAHRQAALSTGSSHIDKDIEMDLGEIGIDGEQQNKREEEWAALDNEVVESSDSESSRTMHYLVWQVQFQTHLQHLQLAATLN